MTLEEYMQKRAVIDARFGEEQARRDAEAAAEKEARQRGGNGHLFLAPPEHLQSDVGRYRSRDDAAIDCGVAYQRCGGGRRVIRKRIGGN